MHQPGMRKQAKATPGSNLADNIPANKSALPRLPNVDAKATPAPLQLARSSAWTDAEIDAGLIRLSPFLNLPLIPKTERPSSDLRLTQGMQGPPLPRQSNIPLLWWHASVPNVKALDYLHCYSRRVLV